MDEPNYDAPVENPTVDNGGSPASPSGPAQQSGTPPPAGAQPGSAQPQAQPQGDWVSRHHLNEVWKAHRQQQEVLTRLQNELQAVRAPKQPAAPPDERSEAIKQEFFKLFPQAQQLFELPLEQVQQLLQVAPQLQAQGEHYWSAVGNGQLRQIRESMRNLYGGQPDAKAQRWAETAFIDWVENDPAAKQRYIAQDPALASDFMKAFEASFLDPIRRKAVVVEEQRGARRAALPRPGPRTAAMGQGPPAKPKTEDELHDAAFAALNAR